MSSSRYARSVRAALAALVVLGAAGCDSNDNPTDTPATIQGLSVYGVDGAGTLVKFGTTNPNVVKTMSITGLQGGESVVGVDFRANETNQSLYALTTQSRIYTIDTTTGAATFVGRTDTLTLGVTNYGFDFNPQVDRIRVHGSSGENLRLNPATGLLAARDGLLRYDTADANTARTPNIVGTAYTNSVRPSRRMPAGDSTTTLYAIDSEQDVLCIVNPPNAGLLRTVGSLGVAASDKVGFDIYGPLSGATAYATISSSSTAASDLYTINLSTGAATKIGTVGHSQPLVGIAVLPY